MRRRSNRINRTQKRRKISLYKITIIMIVIIVALITIMFVNNKTNKKDNISQENIEVDGITTFAITYDLDGGEIPDGLSNANSYNNQSETILLNPSKDGYIFLGWTGSNGDIPDSAITIPAGSTGNRNYKANWEKIKEDDAVIETSPGMI